MNDRASILYAINKGRNVMVILQTKDKEVSNEELKKPSMI